MRRRTFKILIYIICIKLLIKCNQVIFLCQNINYTNRKHVNSGSEKLDVLFSLGEGESYESTLCGPIVVFLFYLLGIFPLSRLFPPPLSAISRENNAVIYDCAVPAFHHG